MKFVINVIKIYIPNKSQEKMTTQDMAIKMLYIYFFLNLNYGWKFTDISTITEYWDVQSVNSSENLLYKKNHLLRPVIVVIAI